MRFVGFLICKQIFARQRVLQPDPKVLAGTLDETNPAQQTHSMTADVGGMCHTGVPNGLNGSLPALRLQQRTIILVNVLNQLEYCVDGLRLPNAIVL